MDTQIKVNPLLSIIIVHFRTYSATKECIVSILRLAVSLSYEIIVVDNASDDFSAERLRMDFPDLTVVSLNRNLGFGSGVNYGMKIAKGDFFLLVNSDIIVRKGVIERMVKCALDSTNVGVVTCNIRYPDGSEQKNRYYAVADFRDIWNDNYVLSKISILKSKELKGVMGSFILIPRRIIDLVGGFDRSFFMYSEEFELMNRIRKRGFSIEVLENYFVYHEIGKSSDKDWAFNQKLLSNFLLYYKINGWKAYYVYLVLFVLNAFCNLIMFFVMGKFKEFRRVVKVISLIKGNFYLLASLPRQFSSLEESGNQLKLDS